MRFAKVVFTLAVLLSQGRISTIDAQPLWPDLLFGILFVVAFVKTRPTTTTARP